MQAARVSPPGRSGKSLPAPAPSSSPEYPSPGSALARGPGTIGLAHPILPMFSRERGCPMSKTLESLLHVRLTTEAQREQLRQLAARRNWGLSLFLVGWLHLVAFSLCYYL